MANIEDLIKGNDQEAATNVIKNILDGEAVDWRTVGVMMFALAIHLDKAVEKLLAHGSGRDSEEEFIKTMSFILTLQPQRNAAYEVYKQNMENEKKNV